MTVLLALLLLNLLTLAAPRRRWSRPLGFAVTAAMFVWGWEPAKALFAATLERELRGPGDADAEGDAIVVLGGDFYPPDRSQPELLPGYGTYLRCHHAAILHRRRARLPVVATAGPVSAGGGRGFDGAESMRRVLIREGVPEPAIWTENRSSNTRDNAVHTAALLRARGIGRIVLVTDAIHMPRARAAFERAGLRVSPAPCASFVARFEQRLSHYLTFRPDNMVTNQNILHEWIGRGWYAIRGWT